jgi:hypothetical protein
MVSAIFYKGKTNSCSNIWNGCYFYAIIYTNEDKIVSNYLKSSQPPVEMTIILRYIYRG